jgi:hypothetical protein
MRYGGAYCPQGVYRLHIILYFCMLNIKRIYTNSSSADQVDKTMCDLSFKEDCVVCRQCLLYLATHGSDRYLVLFSFGIPGFHDHN